MVVDFAVDDGVDAVVRVVVQGLVTRGREIVDGEADVAEGWGVVVPLAAMLWVYWGVLVSVRRTDSIIGTDPLALGVRSSMPDLF